MKLTIEEEREQFLRLIDNQPIELDNYFYGYLEDFCTGLDNAEYNAIIAKVIKKLSKEQIEAFCSEGFSPDHLNHELVIFAKLSAENRKSLIKADPTTYWHFPDETEEEFGEYLETLKEQKGTIEQEDLMFAGEYCIKSIIVLAEKADDLTILETLPKNLQIDSVLKKYEAEEKLKPGSRKQEIKKLKLIKKALETIHKFENGEAHLADFKNSDLLGFKPFVDKIIDLVGAKFAEEYKTNANKVKDAKSLQNATKRGYDRAIERLTEMIDKYHEKQKEIEAQMEQMGENI